MTMPNSQAVQSGSEQTGSTPSAGKHGKTEEKKSRLLHILPKLPSTDSLSNSPGPASPGMYELIMNNRVIYENYFRNNFGDRCLKY